MIAIALLLAVQVAQAAAAATPPSPPAPPPAPMPPADWSGLPALRYVRPADSGADLSDFVRDEVKAGRCARAVAAPGGGWTLTVDLAVLATPQGNARRIVPRAIACATVEQYAAGIVSGLARANLDVADGAGNGWYRTSVTFTWRG